MKRYDLFYPDETSIWAELLVESEDGDFVSYEDYLIQQERAVAAEEKLVQIGQWVEEADCDCDAMLNIAKLLGIVFGSYQEG